MEAFLAHWSYLGVFLILTIALAICGGVGCCIACAAGSCGDKQPGGDVEMPARAGAGLVVERDADDTGV